MYNCVPTLVRVLEAQPFVTPSVNCLETTVKAEVASRLGLLSLHIFVSIICIAAFITGMYRTQVGLVANNAAMLIILIWHVQVFLGSSPVVVVAHPELAR